jgi:RNA polymerase-binding transcription factor DksA
MTIFDMEQNRLRQQEIEVRALVALLKHSRMYRVEAEQRLRYIAFPDQLAKKIEQESILEVSKIEQDTLKLPKNWKRRVKRDYFGNCMRCGIPSEECKCHE